MPADIKEVLRRVVDELDTEERNALLLEMQNKKLTAKELADAIREMPVEERATIRDAFIDVAETEGGRAEKKEAKVLEEEAQHEEEAKGVETPEEKPKKKTRPGRKHGRAYGWTVKNGKVVLTDVATVYSGEDEPDEIEMMDEEEEENEEETEDEE